MIDTTYPSQAVAGHPHWKVVPRRTFDAPAEQRPASWVITHRASGIWDIDQDHPTGAHELVLGVSQQLFEPLPAFLASVAATPAAPGTPGVARFLIADGDTMWFAVPQDWFFKRFQLEQP